MTLTIFIGFALIAIGGLTWAWSGDLLIDVATGAKPYKCNTGKLVVATTIVGVSMILLGIIVMYLF